MNPIVMAIIGGVRPHFIKIAAIQQKIALFNEFHPTMQINPVYINSGQHYSDGLSGAFIREFALSFDFTLDHQDRRAIKIFSESIFQIHEILNNAERKPDWAVVIGDANASLAGALAASKCNIPIIHVEAGSALDDEVSPEVLNGRSIEQLSTAYFCADSQAVERLKTINIAKNVYLTGDVTRSFVIELGKKVAAGYQDYAGGYILATIHHEENTLADDNLETILNCLQNTNRKTLFITHPRFAEKISAIDVKRWSNIEFVPALPYSLMLAAIKGCDYIFTDSGGLQREAYYLNKRCLVRSNVEFWPVFTQADVHKLVGYTRTDIEAGLRWMEKAIHSPLPKVPGVPDDNASFISAMKALLLN